MYVNLTKNIDYGKYKLLIFNKCKKKQYIYKNEKI